MNRRILYINAWHTHSPDNRSNKVQESSPVALAYDAPMPHHLQSSYQKIEAKENKSFRPQPHHSWDDEGATLLNPTE